MKYISADKLIAEIERRLNIVEPHKDTFESAAASRQELIWMKDFITSLQQEQSSLPHNLDEAAEDSWALYEYRESPRGLYSTCYVDGFKAGAEWMAEKTKQEQPEVDLENEIDAVWNPRFNLGWDENSCLTMNRVGFEHFASHFYELGLNTRKEDTK